MRLVWIGRLNAKRPAIEAGGGGKRDFALLCDWLLLFFSDGLVIQLNWPCCRVLVLPVHVVSVSAIQVLLKRTYRLHNQTNIWRVVSPVVLPSLSMLRICTQGHDTAPPSKPTKQTPVLPIESTMQKLLFGVS